MEAGEDDSRGSWHIQPKNLSPRFDAVAGQGDSPEKSQTSVRVATGSALWRKLNHSSPSRSASNVGVSEEAGDAVSVVSKLDTVPVARAEDSNLNEGASARPSLDAAVLNRPAAVEPRAALKHRPAAAAAGRPAAASAGPGRGRTRSHPATTASTAPKVVARCTATASASTGLKRRPSAAVRAPIAQELKQGRGKPRPRSSKESA